MTEDSSYIEEFLEEITDTLTRLDRQFVALEQDPSNLECLTEIFRDLHTIKGSCGLLGLNKLESITHCGENLLGKLRDGKLDLKPVTVNHLLEMMDALWKTVRYLKQDGQEGDADHSTLIENLALLEKGEFPPDNLKDKARDEEASDPPPIDASTIAEFMEEAYEILDLLDRQIVELENTPENPDLLSSLLRSFHTLKGSSGYMGFKKIETLTHSMENLLVTLKEGKTAAETPLFNCLLKMMDTLHEVMKSLKTGGNEGTPPVNALVAEMAGLQGHPSPAPVSAKAEKPDEKMQPPRASEEKSEGANIRVNVELLDSLMNLVGEVVLARNQFARIIHDYNDSTILATSQVLNRVTTDLQETVMKARMQPIKNVWGKLPRMVRDLSMKCGNKVRLEMEGQDSDLDKSLITAIQDPLMNIIRNAIVHGIETPQERRSRGKPEEGVIRLRAFNRSGQIHIEIHDDGRSVDIQALKNLAVNESRITPEQREGLSNKDCGKLLFMSGFSLTENSLMKPAKGNGLTHARTKVEKIGGTLDIEVEPGISTTLKIKLPLTLAIIPALIISSGSNQLAIPQINIKELIWLEGKQNLEQVEEIAGNQFYRLRGDLLPLVHLNHILKIAPLKRHSDFNIVVLQSDDTQFGLVVEQIHNTEEIVVKTLENLLRDIEVFSGVTVMGNGEVVLILDVMRLAKNARMISAKNSHDDLPESTTSAKVEDEDTQAMLIISLGHNRRMAFLLSDVARLEEIKQSDLEKSGKELVVQYRGEIMPIIDIPKLFNTAPQETDNQLLEVVVHTHDGNSMGLQVESIVDIVQAKLNEKRTEPNSKLLGTIVTNNSVVDVINVEQIIHGFLKTY